MTPGHSPGGTTWSWRSCEDGRCVDAVYADSQTPVSEKIAMTAPVAQWPEGAGWVVSFMMPSAYTPDTIPKPTDPRVAIREIPAHRMAAIRYSGRWTESKYRDNLALLHDLCDTMEHGSLCAMGGLTPNPVRSVVRHFPEELGLGPAVVAGGDGR